MITAQLKQRVIEELAERRKNFQGSDQKFSVMLGISNAQYSRIKNGDTHQVLSDANWIALARKLQVGLNNEIQWHAAKTPVFDFITQQLTRCQVDSVSCLLCDIADIGKTFTARHYAKTQKNVVYVDCSQTKSKQKLVRYIAQQFGVQHIGRYQDVYEDLVYYLRAIENPLVILDEAGDLDYPAFLELKALWNATERCCGWMMMGADGLKEKIRRSIDFKKVGYTEIFSRYGKKYQRVTPVDKLQQEEFAMMQAAIIIRVNAPEADVKKMFTKTEGSLRRIYTEIKKLKLSQNVKART